MSGDWASGDDWGWGEEPAGAPAPTAGWATDGDLDADEVNWLIERQLPGLIEQLRALTGMSQQRLATAADCNRHVISRFESRTREGNRSWATFVRLAGAMGYVPKIQLLPRDGVMAARHRRRVSGLEQLQFERVGFELSERGLTSLGLMDEPRAEQAPAPGFETIAIHAGQEPDPLTGAVVPPIFQVSTFAQDGVGGLRGGYEYSRSANPTRTALEQCLAGIEAADVNNGGRGFAFASGLAAEDAFIRAVCKPGDHVVIPGDAYGGTYRLFARVLSDWGVAWTAVMQDDPAAVQAAMQDNTKVVWCETPTNPLLTVSDISALATIAHDGGALLAVDNTFASSYLQQPLTLGADVVMHSTTKYLGGHSDVVGGALVVSDGDLAELIAFIHNATGSVAGPFDSWLVLRGIKTLAVRMERHCDNAEQVAAMLRQHPAVESVLYPDSDPVAKRQMRRFGGMVSFRADNAVEICGRTKVFTLAESLGGVESLIEHPGKMTHASAAGSQLEVPGDLVRLSVGLESAADLIADLEQALS